MPTRPRRRLQWTLGGLLTAVAGFALVGGTALLYLPRYRVAAQMRHLESEGDRLAEQGQFHEASLRFRAALVLAELRRVPADIYRLDDKLDEVENPVDLRAMHRWEELLRALDFLEDP